MIAIPAEALWVRMPRFIGDGVMISQALAPLRAAGKPLVAWGPAPLMDLFEGSGAFAACVPDEGKPRARDMARLLREHRAAGVLVLPRSTRALMGGLLARTPMRVGWSEGGGRFLATASLPFKARTDHQLDRYQALLAKAFPGLPPAPPAPFRARGEAQVEAARLRRELGLEGPYVVLGMGSAAWVKRMGTEVWAGLIERLKAAGIPGLLLGGTFREDLGQAEVLKARFPDLADLCGKTSLPVSAALLEQAAGAVSNDSALGHIGAACGTPLVAAFGPTRPEFTAPRGPKVKVVRKEGLACLGCLVLECPVPGHPCMEALDPARVFEALREVMERS